MTSFVKKTLKQAHAKLVDRLIVKSRIMDASLSNQRLIAQTLDSESPYMTEFPCPAGSSETSSTIEEAQSSPGFPPPDGTPRQSSGFPTPSNPNFRDNANFEDNSLYPKSLSVRSSSTGCFAGSERRSYHGPAGGRISWQNLNSGASKNSYRNSDESYQMILSDSERPVHMGRQRLQLAELE